MIRLVVSAWFLAAAVPTESVAQGTGKLDPVLEARLDSGGRSRVIVVRRPGGQLARVMQKAGVKTGRELRLIDGQVLDVPNHSLRALAEDGDVSSVHLDRETRALLDLTAGTVGALDLPAPLGLTGAGIGVAVIDSGITGWHDDLSGGASGFQEGNQRVVHFLDLVSGHQDPYDHYGHGTHVAGIIAGNGYDSSGTRAGIAPEAHLVSVKVLDSDGLGYVSDLIAALDYVVSIKDTFNIRVVNVSVGAGVYESYWSDPLTLAARRAVEAGLVVVAASGNLGRNDDGETQYGGIAAPGNAPWVVTVGASKHNGTVVRDDDVVAPWSSQGPTYIDFTAKPDIVAPGAGTVSLSDPSSALYASAAD